MTNRLSSITGIVDDVLGCLPNDWTTPSWQPAQQVVTKKKVTKTTERDGQGRVVSETVVEEYEYGSPYTITNTTSPVMRQSADTGDLNDWMK